MAENAALIVNTIDETKEKINVASAESHEISQGMQEVSASTEEISAVIETLMQGLDSIEGKVREEL